MTDIIAAEMNDVQTEAFIEKNLEKALAVFRELGPRSGIRRAVDLPIDIEKLSAAVLNSTMIAFPEGMSRRNKTIVKRTFLFADVTAQIAYPQEKDQIQRWQHMLKGLKVMGWTMFGNPHINYEETKSGLTMSNVVLDIVQSAMSGVAGGVGAAINAGAKTAIDALKDNKEALTLFEKNGKKGDGANFGIASCAVDKEGDVYMVLGGISYYAAAGNTKIAFFDKTSSSAKVYQSKGVFTIYEDDYTERKEKAANDFYEAIDAALELEFGI